jgi:hypothetical protein
MTYRSAANPFMRGHRLGRGARYRHYNHRLSTDVYIQPAKRQHAGQICQHTGLGEAILAIPSSQNVNIRVDENPRFLGAMLTNRNIMLSLFSEIDFLAPCQHKHRLTYLISYSHIGAHRATGPLSVLGDSRQSIPACR